MRRPETEKRSERESEAACRHAGTELGGRRGSEFGKDPRGLADNIAAGWEFLKSRQLPRQRGPPFGKDFRVCPSRQPECGMRSAEFGVADGRGTGHLLA